MKKKAGKTSTGKKVGPVLSVCVTAIAVAALVASAFVGVHLPSPREANTCFSVVADKAAMRQVDRLVVTTPYGETTVTDQAFIDSFIAETTVPDTANVQTLFGYQTVTLYAGEKVVRTMNLDLDGHDTLVQVTDANTPANAKAAGAETTVALVTLNAKTWQQLKTLLKADGNRLATADDPAPALLPDYVPFAYGK